MALNFEVQVDFKQRCLNEIKQFVNDLSRVQLIKFVFYRRPMSEGNNSKTSSISDDVSLDTHNQHSDCALSTPDVVMTRDDDVIMVQQPAFTDILTAYEYSTNNNNCVADVVTPQSPLLLPFKSHQSPPHQHTSYYNYNSDSIDAGVGLLTMNNASQCSSPDLKPFYTSSNSRDYETAIYAPFYAVSRDGPNVQHRQQHVLQNTISYAML